MGHQAEPMSEHSLSNILPAAVPSRLIDLMRIVDIAGCLALLLIALPLVAIVALLIALDSPGPIFMGIPRLGRNGKLFPCYKFRTMLIDGDIRLMEYLGSNPEAKSEWDRYQKLRHDPRVTPVGQFLRKFSFDEIPQFVNVLLGHMSLVGPRPYLARELSLMGSAASVVLSVRPGITGLWQVSGRNAISFSDRIRLESQYVLSRTWWGDLLLLLRTPAAIFSRRGAY